MQASIPICAIVVALNLGASASPALAQSPTDSRGSKPKLVEAPPGFQESCSRYAWLCSNGGTGATGIRGAEALDLAERINRRVNRTVAEVTDAQNYGVADYWTLPANGRGDCEDFVLMKYKLLLEAGVDSRDLAVAVVLRHGENHAVLVLRHSTGDLVLDNLEPEILPWNETRYQYLAMQTTDDKGQWMLIGSNSKRSNVLARR